MLRHCRVYSLFPALLGAGLSTTPGLAAEPDHTHPHDLPEIIITADPLGDVESHLAAPVTVLSEKQLRRESMRSIGSAVANQPGVTSSDFGVSVGRPVIRGLGGGRVRVLENGIGTMDVSTISADHGVTAEPIFANQIEIFRGPATLLYGSGASGGLVNIENGRILTTLPDEVEAELYNHYDTASSGWLGAFKLDGALGANLGVHVDGMARDSEDVDIPGFAKVAPEPGDQPGTLPNSAAESDNLAAGASLIGARGFLGFAVSTYANTYGLPGEAELGLDGEVSGVTIDQEQLRYDVDGTLEVGRYGLERIKTRWGYTDYEHDEVEPGGEIGTRFTNEEIEGRVELIHAPLGAWDGVLGMQINQRDFAAIGEEGFVPPSRQENIAIFLFEKADYGRVHVDAGVRYEHQRADDERANLSANHDLFSVSGGATFEFRSGNFVGFAATRSQRGPTIEELFAGGPHLASNAVEIGDANLRKETSNNIDLHWRKPKGRYRYDFTVFYNDIDDFVFLRSNDRNGDGLADRVEKDFLDTGVVGTDPLALLLLNQVQSDARFMGFELSIATTLSDDARGRFDLRLWTDYVDGELGGGEKVPRLPPLRFGLDLTWERGPANAGFSVVRVSGEDSPAPLDTETSGYTMIDLDVGYTWRAGGFMEMTLFARGSNLADQTARRHASFVKDLAPLPGVSGLFGLRARY